MRALLLALVATLLLAATPALAFDIYINGTKSTGLMNANLEHCSVKFDALGNLHIISPGYRVVVDKAGKPTRVTGSSDFGGTKAVYGKPKMRYVLLYKPNPKVAFTFDIEINGKPFRTIDLSTGPFTVDLTSTLRPGNNQIRVVGKPNASAPPNGTEADIVKLSILQGHERADGAFVAKHPPVWELVRAAIDRNPIDRRSTVLVE